MKTRRFIHQLGHCVVAALLISTPIASADTVTWDGDTSANWSDAGNWDTDPVIPVSGDSLVFSGSANQANTNDIPLGGVGRITLSNAGWDINIGTLSYVYGDKTLVEATGTSSLTGNITSVTDSAVIILNGTDAALTLDGTLTLSRPNNVATLTVNNGTGSSGNTLILGELKMSPGSLRNRTVSGGADVIVSGGVTKGSGNANLIKQGTGTLTVNGASTYTGTTSINAGTLLINGDSSLATGAVTVNNTATLGGSGTLGGDVTVTAEASLAPGASVGILALGGALDISAMAGDLGTLQFELGSIAASDKITVGGTLTIGSGTLNFGDFVFTDVGGLENGTYTLIQGASAPVGSLDATPANLTGTIGAGPATGTLQIDGNDIELVVSGVGGGGNDFSDWIGGFSGLGGLTGVDDDADGDGIDNGVENFFGTPPNAFSQGLVAVAADTGANTFTFTHPLNDTPAGDLTATYRWSTDLTTFYDDGASNGAGTTTVAFAQGTPSGGMVTVTATLSGTVIPSQLFVRVEVLQN